MLKKILKLSAKWCAPCKMYAKTFEEVANKEEYKDIFFEEIDVEDNEEIAEKYMVRSIPTTIFLDENDEQLLTLNGNVSKNVLEEKIKSLIDA